MKIYSKENYNSYEEYATELVGELRKELPVSFELKNPKTNEVGKVFKYKVKVCTNSADIHSDVEFPSRAATYSLSRCTLEMPQEVKEIFNKYLEVITKSYNIYDEEEREEYRLQYEREKKERETRLQQEKFEKRKKSSLEKLNSLRPEQTSKLFSTPMSQYEALGWIAKHAKNIKASMPDYMETWFIKIFGQDAERYVVDSTKKTSGGFDFQWSLGINITFDSPVSGILEQRATSKNKKSINNVAFAWDLIENYGFVFGKKQDYEKIKSEIPTKYLEDFERGYAM
jgi:hypothetical protein